MSHWGEVMTKQVKKAYAKAAVAKADHYMEKADAAKAAGLKAMHYLHAARSQACRDLAIEIRGFMVGGVA